jgi:serine/threonine protein phosphatase PrpC
MPNDAAAAPPDSANAVTAAELTDREPPLDLLQAGQSLRTLAELAEPLPAPSTAKIAGGEAVWISAKCPAKPGENEDAVAALAIEDDHGLLLVADGLGGHRGGRRASQAMKTHLTRTARQLTGARQASCTVVISDAPLPQTAPRPGADSRSAILDEIERVNHRLLRSRIGSATTLALAEVQQHKVRTYHIGDSEILIVSQRGRLKYSTVSHSPIGYAVESGLLTEEEALFHSDRHLVSNVVGSDQMSIELGPWIPLAPRDTVLLASDGLFDNLMQNEVIEGIRKGDLVQAVADLAQLARNRMAFSMGDQPSKPDDLTILAYRRQSR